MNQLQKPSLLAAICIAATLAIGGCGQQEDQGSQKTVTSVASGAGTDSPRTSRFTLVKPDASQEATLKDKTAEFAKDGSWISIVPMQPKAGNVDVRIDMPGNYAVKLTNNKCASGVNVSSSPGSSFVLTASDPKHEIAASRGMELKIAMADSAPNNYFCNVAVAALAD